MKRKFYLLAPIWLGLVITSDADSQVTTLGNNGINTDYLGWAAGNNFPVRIEHKSNNYIDFHTAGVHRARVTTGNLLTSTGGVTSGTSGDGIRIMPKMIGCPIPSTTNASLDLWTSCSNGTNIRWGESGQISGANSRYEQWANYNGFWFNAYGGSGFQPRYIFNTNGTEHARVGLNRFWRIGANPNSVDAATRLESVDFNSPQLRLSHANNNTGTGYTFTDFRTTAAGHLRINPQNSRVGINLPGAGNPSHNLDINGDLRIQNIPVATPNCILVGTNQTGAADNQVSRLDFTGNSTQVLLGNGTWGTAPSGLGNYCGNPINSLTGNYQISLNQNDFFFTDLNNNPNTNRVAIGLNCTPFLAAKFTVNQNNTTNVNQNTTAIRGVNLNNANNNPTVLILRGVWGEAIGGANSKNLRIGGDFRATTNNSPVNGYNYGVRGVAGNLPITVGAPTFHVGGLFYSQSNYSGSTQFSVGVAGVANSSAGINIGVYGAAPDLTTSAGPDFAGYFNGDVLYTGQVSTSDAMFKYNINEVENALDIISELKPRSYFYDATAFQGKMKFQTSKQYGFIAQDVEQILPELVGKAVQPGRTDTLGNIIFNDFEYKTLNYQGFFALLTKGIQEQQILIDSLENLLSNQDSINNALYSMITSCCSNNSTTENNSINQNPTLDITLSDNVPSIVLDQNVPNPFAEQTTITYTLTDGVKKAQMLFYNIEGKLIQSVDLSTASGKGQMNVFANDLSTGVYTYTLVVDGEIKGTKRMVKN